MNAFLVLMYVDLMAILVPNTTNSPNNLKTPYMKEKEKERKVKKLKQYHPKEYLSNRRKWKMENRK